MKSTRKLIMATLMLVVAFIAATASTYAWFTSNQEAKVENINMKAGSEGNDLQISLTGTEGTWGYEVKLGDLFGSLKPSSFDKTAKGFYSLTIPQDETLFAYEKLQVNLADIEEENNADGEATFLAFDLFFRTSNQEVTKLNFNTSSIFTGNNAVLDTLRVMFLVVDKDPTGFTDFVDGTTKIYEHNKVSTSTFGTGSYYNPSNSYIAYNAFQRANPFASLGAGFENRLTATFFETYTSGNYVLDEDFAKDAQYKTVGGSEITNNTIQIGTFNSTENVIQIKVVIWMEGWDGDTTNAAALKTFSAALKFSGTN